MVEEKIKKILEKQHYNVFGENSGLQTCLWTKKSLLDEGICYKEKFYGIPCHRCVQMSPAIVFCPNACLHCWRPIELTKDAKMSGKWDEPIEIIEKAIMAQRKMLSGFGGNEKINKKKFKEAQNPSQFAISLAGEPTLYPKIAELILLLKEKDKTSFLVTNGLYPEKVEEMQKKKALPTQIYLSLNSPNEKMYIAWHNSKLKDAWQRFNKTLDLFKKIKKETRTVIRMTLVRERNIKKEHAKEYAELIKKSMPDFIEVKAFMSVGFSRQRMGYEEMPSHKEIKEFSAELLKFLPKEYRLVDEKEESRVVLLSDRSKKQKITD